MSADGLAELVRAIRQASCIPMATPFDEKSVDLCCDLGIQIVKLASSDLNDWVLHREDRRHQEAGDRLHRRLVR